MFFIISCLSLGFSIGPPLRVGKIYIDVPEGKPMKHFRHDARLCGHCHAAVLHGFTWAVTRSVWSQPSGTQ